MALTKSKDVELSSNAPSFQLTDTVSGETTTYDDIRGDKGTVIMFICNHCPFVQHVQEELVTIANQYMPEIGFVAISSNDAEKFPEDGPEKMSEVAHKQQFPFRYLYDESQEVALAYNAACTPDFFVYDKNDELVYHGQLDDSRPGKKEPNGEDLREALDAIVQGKTPSTEQKPSVGCSIKWKS